MNALTLSMMVAVLLVGADLGRAGVVTLLWEQVGSDVRLTVTGSLDVAGWDTTASNIGSTTVRYRNTSSGGVYHSVDLARPTTGGQRYADGFFVLRPWEAVTGAEATGTFVSGTFAGSISLYSGEAPPSVTITVPGTVTGGSHAVDGVFRFGGTTLAALFGDRLALWSSGATVAKVGSNDLVFTTQKGPGGGAEFRCTAIVRTGAATYDVTWTSETGVTYRLETSTDLVTWSPVGSNVAATGPVTTQGVSHSSGDGKRYWRVKRI